jgi:fermentation-respiration switch protein FrsA (DUF1100 family)
MITLAVCGMFALPFMLCGGIIALFRKGRRMRVWKWTGAAYLIGSVILLWGFGPYLMARFVADAGSRPMDGRLSETPSSWKVPYEEVVFQAVDGVWLSGWFAPPRGSHTLIIYSHGLFRNRHEMLERAMKLCRLGYGVLLYDARHHGHSDKAVVSLGYFERFDVLGARRFVRQKPETHGVQIVLMGVSMGAAAVLMAAAETKDYDALVLDSPFLNFEETVIHHAWLFLKMPRYPFVPLFLHFYRQRAGFDPSQFDVAAAAGNIRPVPVLMIHGGKDERIPVQDGKEIFDKLSTALKQFYVVEEATHGAGYRFAPDAYLSQLTAFLQKHLE